MDDVSQNTAPHQPRAKRKLAAALVAVLAAVGLLAGVISVQTFMQNKKLDEEHREDLLIAKTQMHARYWMAFSDDVWPKLFVPDADISVEELQPLRIVRSEDDLPAIAADPVKRGFKLYVQKNLSNPRSKMRPGTPEECVQALRTTKGLANCAYRLDGGGTLVILYNLDDGRYVIL